MEMLKYESITLQQLKGILYGKLWLKTPTTIMGESYMEKDRKISFKCPKCGKKRFSVPAIYAGKSATCPACKNRITIPHEDQSTKEESKKPLRRDAQPEFQKPSVEKISESEKRKSLESLKVAQKIESKENEVNTFPGCTAVLFFTILWIVLVTVFTLNGTWNLGWGGYFGLLFGGILGLFILSAPGYSAMGKAAKEFSQLQSVVNINKGSQSARDEAAIRLAVLYDCKCYTPFLFRTQLEKAYTFFSMTISIIYDAFSWIAVLGGQGGGSVAAAFLDTGSPAVKAGKMLGARKAIIKLRGLYNAGVFTEEDVQLASRGLLPSNPEKVWCATGIGGDIYLLSRTDQHIHIREIHETDDTEIPVERFEDAAVPDFDGKRKHEIEKATKILTKAQVDQESYYFGAGRLIWVLPEIKKDEKPLLLQSALLNESFSTISLWCKPPLKTKLKGKGCAWYLLTFLLLLFALSVLVPLLVIGIESIGRYWLLHVFGLIAGIWGIARIVTLFWKKGKRKPKE